jgi:hypothetical protein
MKRSKKNRRNGNMKTIPLKFTVTVKTDQTTMQTINEMLAAGEQEQQSLATELSDVIAEKLMTVLSTDELTVDLQYTQAAPVGLSGGLSAREWAKQDGFSQVLEQSEADEV